MMKPQLRVSVLALSVVFPLIFRDLSARPPPQSKKVPPQADINAIGNRNVGEGVNLYPREKEIALGKQLAQEVERSAKLIDDSLTTEYVNRLCQSLTRNSDAQMPITIRVIDSGFPDGFTLPGGFLYINKGLILHAQTEAGLAGALAHPHRIAQLDETGDKSIPYSIGFDSGHDFSSPWMGRMGGL